MRRSVIGSVVALAIAASALPAAGLSRREQAKKVAAAKAEALEHRERGLGALAKKDETTAALELEKAIALDPADPVTQHELGKIRFKQGQLPQAIARFELTVKLAPNDALAWYNLGYASRKSQQFERAAEAYQECLALAPDELDAIYGLAESLRQAGKGAEAVEAYRQYVAKEARPGEAKWVQRSKERIAELERAAEKAKAKREAALQAAAGKATAPSTPQAPKKPPVLVVPLRTASEEPTGSAERPPPPDVSAAEAPGRAEAAASLAAAGADPNAPGVDGLTLLDRAVTAGRLEQISLLLKIGADPNCYPAASASASPLGRIFQSGNLPLFQIFLDHGAKPVGGNWDAWLWQAFERRDHEAARLLLSHGANAATRGPHGQLLVEIAAHRREGSFVKMLTDYGSPVGGALYQSSARGDLDMVSLLISCGQPVNVTRIPSLDTPLGAAIRAKQDRVASLLIQNGADVNLRLPEGQAPLHLAIATGCHRTVKDLLDAGADPNTPFDLPASPAFLKNVRLGVMRWVLKNDRNVTPLMMAADSGVILTAHNLIRAGGKVDARTRSTSLWPINFASRRQACGQGSHERVSSAVGRK